jgi:hypothetical protein
MPEWMEREINREAREQKKRWNGKVITTSRQWTENASGAREPDSYTYSQIWDAVKDYQKSRSWN